MSFECFESSLTPFSTLLFRFGWLLGSSQNNSFLRVIPMMQIFLFFGGAQLEIGHHRFGAGRARLRLLPCRTLDNQCRLQCGNVLRQRFGRYHTRLSHIGEARSCSTQR